MSLCKNSGISCGDAYQRDRQSRFTPNRNPIGLTFCPIIKFRRNGVREWWRNVQRQHYSNTPTLHYSYSLVHDFFAFFGACFACFSAFALANSPSAFASPVFFFAAFCAAFRVSRVSILISSVSTIRMWLLRFKMRLPLPRARAIIRFIVGPSPTTASFTTSPSAFRFALFSAFATALFSVLPMRNAAFFGVNASRSSAAENGSPWISRVTSRTLNGEIRAYL